MQYTKSHEDSEELVHDLYVQLWQKREMVRDDLPIVHLLYYMMRNTLINRFHARVNSPTYELFTDYNNNPTLSVSDTLHRLEYDDFCKQLDQYRQELPATQQRIVAYKLFDDLESDEIAERLQLSKQTIKNQLSLALKYLRERIGQSRMMGWICVALLIIQTLFNLDSWYRI